MTHFRRAVGLACLLGAYAAAETHLHFEDEHNFYDATFDPGRISAARMQRLVLMSPFLRVRVAGALLFVESWRYGAPEDRQLDIRLLEACSPGDNGCGQGRIDDAFLANAAHNLDRDKDEIRLLRKAPAPKPLKPVRQYLIDQAEFLLKVQQARYRYFESHDVAPLRKVMCDVCPCAGPETDILDTLRTASPSAGYDVTNNWYNRTLGCHDALTRKYPIEAWRAFTVRYGIVEKYGRRP